MTEITEVAYQSIRSLNDNYLLEYSPPNKHLPYSSIQITLRKPLPPNLVAELIESEVHKWIAKFPITTMVAAFHPNDDCYDLTEVRASSLYVCYFDKAETLLKATWEREVKEPAEVYFPQGDPKGYFAHLAITKKFNPEKERNKLRKQVRFMKFTVLIWFAIIPAAYEIANYLGPKWLSLLVCIYGLFKAAKTGLKTWGILHPTSAEIAKRKVEEKKNHYYYHCERNPQGFLRIKGENFDKDAENKFSSEIDLLQSSQQAQDNS